MHLCPRCFLAEKKVREGQKEKRAEILIPLINANCALFIGPITTAITKR